MARGGGIIDDAELPAVELLDLGEHRLKGLPSKQRLFQLQVSGLPSKFPPPRTLEAEGRRPGVGTFISTDLAGSRRLIRELGDEASAALFAEYRKAVTTAVEAGNGVVLECSGDHAFAVFGSPSDALRAAAGVRQAVRSLSWQSDWDVPVEIIVHSGRWSGDPHEPAASPPFAMPDGPIQQQSSPIQSDSERLKAGREPSSCLPGSHPESPANQHLSAWIGGGGGI